MISSAISLLQAIRPIQGARTAKIRQGGGAAPKQKDAATATDDTTADADHQRQHQQAEQNTSIKDAVAARIPIEQASGGVDESPAAARCCCFRAVGAASREGFFRARACRRL